MPLEHRICPCPPAHKSVLVSGMHGRFHRRSLERALRSLPAEEEEAEIDGEGSEELQAVLRECQSKRDLPVLVISFSVSVLIERVEACRGASPPPAREGTARAGDRGRGDREAPAARGP